MEVLLKDYSYAASKCCLRDQMTERASERASTEEGEGEGKDVL